ncbi:diguanylate cyclase domain protein [Clostridiales bacterium oral taxon 876 str. F0540]|nr:diguanylate cyclase domain protein [Clostridiales bacterium oral taxon 876 str. F0540]
MRSHTDDNFVSRELKIEVDKKGIITRVSSNCYNVIGYKDCELIGAYIFDYIDYSYEELKLVRSFNAEIEGKDRVKGYFDIQVNTTDEGIFLSIIDISKYKELEKMDKMKLKMFEKTKDIVCRFEILPKPRFIYLSPSVEKILGYPLEDYMKNPMLPFELVHPEDREAQYSKIKADTDFSKLFQVRMRHKDGHYIWLEDYIIPEFDENNQYVACESITRNIQDRKELELRLEKLGYTDNLTGLYNKNYFLKQMDMLNTSIDVPVGIVACDLDNLKNVNDSLGHSKGDSLIKRTAKVMQLVFNDDEYVVSRTGGDEFVVIIKNKSFSQVKELYLNLQMAIKLFNENNKSTPIHISIGFSYIEKSISKMQSAIDTADKDMYKNKKYRKQINIV